MLGSFAIRGSKNFLAGVKTLFPFTQGLEQLVILPFSAPLHDTSSKLGSQDSNCASTRDCSLNPKPACLRLREVAPPVNLASVFGV